jgi:hypothetical protein
LGIGIGVLGFEVVTARFSDSKAEHDAMITTDDKGNHISIPDGYTPAAETSGKAHFALDAGGGEQFDPDEEGSAADECSEAQSAPEPAAEPLADRASHYEEDWDGDPPRREASADEAESEFVLDYLDYPTITNRHLRLLDKLIDLTHPLATEYLTTAQAVSPDAPGRERILNMGCKLVGSTNQLIATSGRLRNVA